MEILVALLLSSWSASAQNWECVRVRVQPSSLCENLRASVDHTLCTQKPQVKNNRIECKNEFFAEFIFEADNQVYRVALTKSANGIWSAGQPVLEPPPKPVVVAPPPVETKPEPLKPNHRFRADFRIRAENNRETNLASNSSPTFLRVKPGVEWQIQPKIVLTVEAQAAKSWGQEDFATSSATSNSRARTSGQNYDNNIALHQGYLSYFPKEDFDLKIGRRVLNYGEGLLVGDNNWHSVGRSFDVISGRWTRQQHWLEVFGAKLVDRSVTNGTTGNEDLNGAYLHTECREGKSNLDLYVFDYQDTTNVDANGNAIASRTYQIWSYGGIVKSEHGPFDYRIEYTKQAASVSANQVDAQFGWTFEEPNRRGLIVGYFDADPDFNQLFSSSHKWLGYADVFSRRNIQGYWLRGHRKFNDITSFEISYLWLYRHSESKSSFSADGAAYGTTSSSRELGTELNIEVKFQLEKELELLLGYADFMPGTYVKDQYNGIDPLKWYVQLAAKF